jgi:dihydroorotate dehydrogenase (NAD+) catalytic subunit
VRDRLAMRLGRVALKNPLICGSGEHVMREAGIRRAIEAGAGAVVIKSTNESEAAREQLDRSDYALLDSAWKRIDWRSPHPADISLLCRSGLAEQSFEEWLDLASRMDRFAASHDAFLIASLVPADIGCTVAFARQMEAAGIRVLEVNVGAPHGDEAVPGAIRLVRTATLVRDVTSQVRRAVSLPLWIKITGQSEDIPALVEAARDAGADAVTVMGRLMGFLPDLESMRPLLGTHAAFGGPWSLPLTCYWLSKSRQRVGAQFPLLGTNGARTGLDVARFLLSGAHAVQMTSAILTGGFGVVANALDCLNEYLERHGTNAAGLVGRAADEVESYLEQPRRPGYWQQFVPEGTLD